MSVQFGVCNFVGGPVDLELIRAADASLSSYAPDVVSHYSGAGIAVAYHALHTTLESRCEVQPYHTESGGVLMWDGRLDNREELILELRLKVSTTDVEIVGASFDRWGTKCFERLIGDWAMSIWSDRDRVLILAKDFIGIRPLFYVTEADQVRWSSVLESLVALSGRRLLLNQQFVAGWLAMYPPANVTPYVGIHAVPPCSFVCLGPGRHTITKYWDFDPHDRIRYRSDAEYEEHFQTLFRDAVRRRLRTDFPICCELSGGMDSPSITCMADLIAATSERVPEIKTLSFYDDSEPNANERPYFMKVEEKRGRTGCHINMTGMELFRFGETAQFQPRPTGIAGCPREITDQQEQFLRSNGIRVVLSGIGGDEVMGGVPSPIPELQDLIVDREFRQLAHKLKLWALNKRTPWFHLLVDALTGFLPPKLSPGRKHLMPAPWLDSCFVDRNRYILGGFERRVTIRGSAPSLQANLHALETLRRQLATKDLPSDPPHEKRYPFLDRTLLEFVYAIPREQLLRPGYRRSLMRRALAGIVPADILERRRKAFANRSLRAAIAKEWDRLSILSKEMVSSRFGFVDESLFRDSLLMVRNADQLPLLCLIRTIFLEAWLRDLRRHGVLEEPEGIVTGMETLGAVNIASAR